MSYIEPYFSHPAQRTKTVLVIEAELAALTRRRPVEFVRGIDLRGDWLFGIELRQVNSLTLTKVRALAPDGTTVLIGSNALSEWPTTVEIRHSLQELGSTELGALTVSFDSPNNMKDNTIELDTVPFKLMEFRTFVHQDRELVSPWVSLALTA